MALAILSFVLLGSTAIAAVAFRTGQTARERTQIAEAAQEQMEALRSFRDNHTWAEFRQGSAGLYSGIDDMVGTTCQYDSTKRCFHMALGNAGNGTNDWVPVTGATTAVVPTSVIEISTSTANSKRQCGYDFELHYSFTPLGGSTNGARNQIVTRLANLKYDPGAASPDCPS
jgi:hypothetical protein